VAFIQRVRREIAFDHPTAIDAFSFRQSIPLAEGQESQRQQGI
jgi:hypothetical protein